MIEPAILLGLSVAAFLAATLATMMGFGIGTILTPIFALVFRTQVAVMLVAVVHFLSNGFRVLLFRRHLDLGLVRRFGLLSIAGALVGSLAQGTVQSDWLKVILGVLLLVLAGIELLPGRSGWHFPRRFDRLGGLLSGLLGGFLGNQGAVRGAYLANYPIPKESFVATAALIAVSIDSTRIPVYLYTQGPELIGNWPTLLATVGSAYLGTLAGQRLVGKISQTTFRRWVNTMIFAFGVAMVGQGTWQATASATPTALAALLAPLAALALIAGQRALSSRGGRGPTEAR